MPRSAFPPFRAVFPRFQYRGIRHGVPASAADRAVLVELRRLLAVNHTICTLPRRLAMSSGTITLRRPRVRGVEERFESRVLPLFARRTKELGALLPELYLHGLAEGDFELAMRGLLGEGAPLSKSSIRRLRAGWTAEFEEWSQRRLEGREVVYVWADGMVKSRVVCKSERKLLDASVRLPWRPPWARGVRGPGNGARSRAQ